jgi:proton-translocating NADH-quinone oxidoreductase chain N
MKLELFELYHVKEMSLSTELFLSCSILQFTFYAISTAYQRKSGFVILNSQVYYVSILLIIFASLLLLNEDLLTAGSLTSNSFVVNDYLSFIVKLVICLVSVGFLFITNVAFRDEPVNNNFEYVVLVVTSILGLLLLCSSNDLILAYLAIELQSVAFYIMAAFKKNSNYSVESGLKYFIIGSLSSAFFLFGSSLIYGCVGSLSFDDLNMFLSLSTCDSFLSDKLSLVYIGFIILCISILIKLAVAPFHFWSLDVYEGSPNSTTFFFAVVPKIGLFLLLMRICYVGFYDIFVAQYQIYFFVFAILSIFVGSVGGLEQRKLKTLLAYSSIGHTGYLLLSFSSGNIEGIQMMFYYLVIYMISSLCLWSVYMFVRQKRSRYFNKTNKELGDLVLLKESNPMLALILSITLFSIAGIPPLVGFLAKIGVFLTVIKSSAYLVAVISILLSVISTFYYIRLIKILYFENSLVGKLYEPITTQKSLLISLLAISIVILCIDPMIVYLIFVKAMLLL